MTLDSNLQDAYALLSEINTQLRKLFGKSNPQANALVDANQNVLALIPRIVGREALKLVITILICAAGLAAQTAASAAPALPASPGSFLSTMADPLVISMAAYDLAQVAQGATAWKFTVAGKVYSVSAAQQTGIAAASTVAAAAIAHKWPRLKMPLTVALAAVSAYYGGKAYAQAQSHGTAPAITP